jgi:uncharacterized membrane protein YidH (DUF202 family)
MKDYIIQKYLYLSTQTSDVNCLNGEDSTDKSNLCQTDLPVIGANTANVQTMLQLLFGILAVIAVIMITLGGIRFITESTNPQETTKARNTIVYAAVGLAIAISGQIIVTFVLNRVS